MAVQSAYQLQIFQSTVPLPALCPSGLLLAACSQARAHLRRCPAGEGSCP